MWQFTHPYRASAPTLALVIVVAFSVGRLLSGVLLTTDEPDTAPVVVAPVDEVPVVSRSVEPRVLDISDLPNHRVRAAGAIVYNPETHEIVWESGARERRPERPGWGKRRASPGARVRARSPTCEGAMERGLGCSWISCGPWGCAWSATE